MALFNLVGSATLRSPRVLASMARAALPVLATVRQPVLFAIPLAPQQAVAAAAAAGSRRRRA